MTAQPEYQTIMVTLRRSLIGVVALIDKLLGEEPTYPTKDERKILVMMREKGVNPKAVRQFVSQQLT